MRIVLGLAPGGGADVVLRMLVERLRERLGQAVIVENLSGAGGTIASAKVAVAQPDGYTLEAKTVSAAVVSALAYKNLPYRAVEDFQPVSMIARAPLVAVVAQKTGVKDLDQLLALLRAEPGKHTFGSSGAGSILHLAGEMFSQSAGLQIIHVPYRGSAPALQGLLSGDITMVFDTIGNVQPQIEAGNVRAIGVASMEPTPIMPDLPPMGRVIPNFSIDTWLGLYAPAKTPKPIVNLLSRHVVDALREPSIVQRLAALSWEAGGSTPEAFADFWAKQFATLGPLIERLKIQV